MGKGYSNPSSTVLALDYRNLNQYLNHLGDRLIVHLLANVQMLAALHESEHLSIN